MREFQIGRRVSEAPDNDQAVSVSYYDMSGGGKPYRVTAESLLLLGPTFGLHSALVFVGGAYRRFTFTRPPPRSLVAQLRQSGALDALADLIVADILRGRATS